MSGHELQTVREAVTTAATLLSMLKRQAGLDDRDRESCRRAQEMLERAEAVLYPRPAAAVTDVATRP